MDSYPFLNTENLVEFFKSVLTHKDLHLDKVESWWFLDIDSSYAVINLDDIGMIRTTRWVAEDFFGSTDEIPVIDYRVYPELNKMITNLILMEEMK